MQATNTQYSNTQYSNISFKYPAPTPHIMSLTSIIRGSISMSYINQKCTSTAVLNVNIDIVERIERLNNHHMHQIRTRSPASNAAFVGR
jgi:hypothetical protein